MESSKAQSKTCPACGAGFVCTHDATCWCMNYSVPEDNLKIIRQKYSDCLCPGCLQQYTINSQLNS